MNFLRNETWICNICTIHLPETKLNEININEIGNKNDKNCWLPVGGLVKWEQKKLMRKKKKKIWTIYRRCHEKTSYV